jgi:hypothetical protein
VTVALSSELPYPGAIAIVFHRVTVTPHDVILLRGEATVRDLEAALATYRRVRDRPRAARVVIKGTRGLERTITPGRRNRVDSLLVTVRGGSISKVDGIGDVRAIEIRVPK